MFSLDHFPFFTLHLSPCSPYARLIATNSSALLCSLTLFPETTCVANRRYAVMQVMQLKLAISPRVLAPRFFPSAGQPVAHRERKSSMRREAILFPFRGHFPSDFHAPSRAFDQRAVQAHGPGCLTLQPGRGIGPTYYPLWSARQSAAGSR